MPTLPAKKVLIITYYWPPAGGPGVQRWLKFARYLPDYGFDPVILTVNEKQASYAFLDHSYQQDIPASMRVYRTPTRELYSIYLKLTGHSKVPFSGFVREGHITLKEKIIRFLRTNLFIPDPRRGWNHFAVKKASQLIRQEKIDRIVTSGPPQSTHLIGLRLKKKFPGLLWLADFRDPWTRVFFFDQLEHSCYSRSRHHAMERKVLSMADRITVVSHSMKKDFITDHTVDTGKISIIPNGYDSEDFAGTVPVSPATFTITYTGTLADNYRIESLLQAVSELNRKKPASIKLLFIGEICQKYRDLAFQTLSESDLELLPPVSHRQAIDFMRRSDMLLLVIPDAPFNDSILTGKLFEYLATGKPILGIGPVQGNAAEILAETKAGTMIDYANPEAIQTYIQHSIAHPGLTKPVNIEKYSRQNLTGQLARLL